MMAALPARLASRFPLGRLAAVAVVRGGVTAANLGIFAALGRVYGLETVGLFASYLAVVTLLGSLVSAGLPEMLMRRMSAAGELPAKALRTLRTPYWAMAVMLIAASVVPGYFAIQWFESRLLTPLPLVAALGPGAYVFGLLISEEYRGRGRAEAALVVINFGTILAPLVGLIASVLLATPKAAVLNVLVWAQVLASLMVAVGFAVTSGFRANRLGSYVRVWRVLRWPDLISMACMRLLSTGASQVAVLIVGAFGAPSLSGFVAISTRLAGLAATYTGIINAAFARRIGAVFRSPAESWRLFVQTSLLATFGVGLLMLPVIALPGFFLGIFGADGRVAGSAYGLQILAVSRILRAVAGISDLFLLVAGRAHFELIATMAGFGCLLCGLVLFPATPVGVSSALAASVIIHGGLSVMWFVWLGRDSRHGNQH